MPRRRRQLAESGIYHVMLRGVNRDALFLETRDYERFLATLRVVREASGCHILAYCLMTNHVHLVLRTTEEPIGAVVKRLGVSYSGWFNRRYGRVGHLFQDRFKSQVVEDDEYFVTLIHCVWNNPVEAGLVDRPEHYPWSSRRQVGHASSVVDETELRRLMPFGHLEELMDARAPVAPKWSIFPDQPPRHSDEQVIELVRRACGAPDPGSFAELAEATRLDVIRGLRMRSVSYAQIARATGMSISSVRRAHLSGQASSTFDVA